MNLHLDAGHFGPDQRAREAQRGLFRRDRFDAPIIELAKSVEASVVLRQQDRSRLTIGNGLDRRLSLIRITSPDERLNDLTGHFYVRAFNQNGMWKQH
ncbi:hypothetical protein D3C73_1461670 [compost metagenome]